MCPVTYFFLNEGRVAPALTELARSLHHWGTWYENSLDCSLVDPDLTFMFMNVSRSDRALQYVSSAA